MSIQTFSKLQNKLLEFYEFRLCTFGDLSPVNRLTQPERYTFNLLSTLNDSQQQAVLSRFATFFTMFGALKERRDQERLASIVTLLQPDQLQFILKKYNNIFCMSFDFSDVLNGDFSDTGPVKLQVNLFGARATNGEVVSGESFYRDLRTLNCIMKTFDGFRSLYHLNEPLNILIPLDRRPQQKEKKVPFELCHIPEGLITGHV